MARHKAWLGTGWEKTPTTRVVVARFREGGFVETGVFLVDAWCLGVKDAWSHECGESELEELVEEVFGKSEFAEAAPADARALVLGAIDYASSLGFVAHRDFRKARRVLSGITGEPSRSFVFGYNGQPHYIADMDESEERIQKVVAVLRARCGPDGFIFFDPHRLIETVDEEDPKLALYRPELPEGGGALITELISAWSEDAREVASFVTVNRRTGYLFGTFLMCPDVDFRKLAVELIDGWEDMEEEKAGRLYWGIRASAMLFELSNGDPEYICEDYEEETTRDPQVAVLCFGMVEAMRAYRDGLERLFMEVDAREAIRSIVEWSGLAQKPSDFPPNLWAQFTACLKRLQGVATRTFR